MSKFELLNETEEPRILDSGERTEYATGAVRDIKRGKGRCDLMPLDVVSEMYFNATLMEAAGFFSELHAFKKDGSKYALYNAMNEVLEEFFRGSSEMFMEVSKHFENGAEKYGENNWQKGIPVHSYIDSAIRHYLKARRGDTDEPHATACVWNLMCCAWTMIHHPELDDFTEKAVPTCDD